MSQYQTNNWSHGLFGCLSDVQLSLFAFFAPCIIHGQTAEDVYAGPCLPCGISVLVPGMHIYSLVYVREKIRTQRGIDGTLLNDVLVSLLCPFCVVAQHAQEVKHTPYDQSMARE